MENSIIIKSLLDFMPFMSGGGFSGTRRVMVFIDGGYLRKGLSEIFGFDKLNYEYFVNALRSHTSYATLFPELIRTYYYDAIPDHKEEPEKYEEQEVYLKNIKNVDYIEVKTGRLKRDGKGSFKQKGVDSLIAIDMVSKGYEDHYDVAVLVAGDEDFLDVVRAVKNTGKRVYGAYFPKHISQELLDNFDKRIILTNAFFTGMT